MPPSSLIAVDIGNSRIKFGLFTGRGSDHGLPEPVQTLELSVAQFDPLQLEIWLAETASRADASPAWWIASVNRPPTEALVAWLKRHAVSPVGDATDVRRHARDDLPGGSYRLLKHTDLPLAVLLPEPDRVGIDRLVGAIAANRVRAPNRAAIIIGVGSAITVDLVSAEGAFVGGAILPGIGMSARAMHAFTDQLPLMAYEELAEPPPALGTTTAEAMRSGLYWGAVGAMKELIARLGATSGTDVTATSDRRTRKSVVHDIFLTGGAAPTVSEFLDPSARYIPRLRLSGIAVVAQQ
jgi:type III pantothenate kinase